MVHPFASHHEGPGFNPQGGTYVKQDSPVSIVCYIGDPDVIDHCGLVWGGLRPRPSLGCRADNVIIPLDLTQLFCPGFTLAAGPPSNFTTDIVAARGSPVESLQSHCFDTMSHWSSRLPICFSSWGSQVPFPGGTSVKPGFSCLRCFDTCDCLFIKKQTKVTCLQTDQTD
jgi:hypothetical protein